MHELIIVRGASGSGKTTICKLLKKKLACPYLELDWLREYHLDQKWTLENKKEEKVAFENLILIAKNYIKHGYKNLMVSHLDFQTKKLLKGVGTNSSSFLP